VRGRTLVKLASQAPQAVTTVRAEVVPLGQTLLQLLGELQAAKDSGALAALVAKK
jgi:hypothetical protein